MVFALFIFCFFNPLFSPVAALWVMNNFQGFYINNNGMFLRAGIQTTQWVRIVLNNSTFYKLNMANKNQLQYT